MEITPIDAHIRTLRKTAHCYFTSSNQITSLGNRFLLPLLSEIISFHQHQQWFQNELNKIYIFNLI